MSIDDSAAWDYVPEPGPGPRTATATAPQPAPEPDPEPEPGLPHPPEPDDALPDDLVTRLLSARAYLSDTFADRVAADLLRPGRRALSPLWMVDALTLARHAARAKGYRRSRDVNLAATLGYLLLAGAAVLLISFTDLVGLRQVIAVWLVLAVVAYVVAVRLVYRQSLAARRSAVAVIYEPQDVRPEPLPRASVEAALADLNRSNVVLFRGDSSPFVGSGVNVDTWSLTIDISKRAAPAHNRGAAASAQYTSRPAAPDEITGGELQEYLVATMPGRISPQPAAGHRLYVRGGSNALSVPVFRSGPTEDDPTEALTFRRPVSRVPDDVIRHYLHDQDAGARVYSYVTHAAWGGQVVVTLFVRAFVSNQTLFIEGMVYALRPLAQQFYSVRGLPTDPRAEASTLFRAAVSDALPQLVRAPARLQAARRSARIEAAASALLEDEITGRRDIDFGAWVSLREQVANYNLADQFAANDERMYYQIFNRRAIESIGAFLEAKHVDLAEFQAQAGAVIAGTTANARSIYGTAGSNGVSATDAGD